MPSTALKTEQKQSLQKCVSTLNVNKIGTVAYFSKIIRHFHLFVLKFACLIFQTKLASFVELQQFILGSTFYLRPTAMCGSGP